MEICLCALPCSNSLLVVCREIYKVDSPPALQFFRYSRDEAPHGFPWEGLSLELRGGGIFKPITLYCMIIGLVTTMVRCYLIIDEKRCRRRPVGWGAKVQHCVLTTAMALPVVQTPKALIPQLTEPLAPNSQIENVLCVSLCVSPTVHIYS